MISPRRREPPVRDPLFPGSTRQRIRTYLVVNLVAIWTSVVALVVLNQQVPSRSIVVDIVALVVAGAAYAVALVLATRGALGPAAAVAVGGTWLVAFSLAWATPFTTPVALLVLYVPALILTDAFGPRSRTVLLTATVVLTGALVVVGESRREVWDANHPEIPVLGLLVGLFTLIVAGVLVVGIRDTALRVTRHSRDLEESRTRLAAASLDARRDIERDLHDGAQQRLTTLAVDIGRLTRALDTDPERARTIAHGLHDQLQAAIRELRDLAHGIYPTVLTERGLAGALPAAARRTAVACVVDVDGLRHRHASDVEAAVYFCCLEAMQNADRHAQGSLISVEVSDDARDGEPVLRFRVSDDGRGFDVGRHRGAHGLAGMRDRILSAGGRLEIRSVPGGGTTVEGRFRKDTSTAR
ncbi:sensor histidine kinase [Phycicoccus avicenniae]|uniref:sensor histidine kinase n=1 Tax=Phycicoccus avicenniae TaxID=2828860 RepID=UPI003D2BAA9D